MTHGELIDEERFAELRHEFPADVVAEVVATFRETTPPMVEELVQAVRAGDADAVARAAHRVKGGCMVIGALALEQVAGALERDGLPGSVAGERSPAVVADEVDDLWRRTDAELARRVGVTGG